MDRTEFDKKVEIFRRMVATLDSAADLISSVWEEDHDGSADAIRDLSDRVKSALDSVGIDVDEWLAEEALDVIPGTEAAKRIERIEEIRARGLAETDRDEAAICTCGSWTEPTSGPSNVAHGPECALMIEEDER